MAENQESSSSSNNPVAAIGFSTDESSGVPLETQPHPPRNLQDLLRYSTEAASLLGEPFPALSARPLDEESKKFLEEALKSMTIDVVQELLKSIHTLKDADQLSESTDPVEYEQALDHIFDFVDNIDVANDFHKIGGFCVLKPCLESAHSTLRWRGAELVAELCQNNPYCQNKMLQTGLMSNLLKMIDSDESDTVRVKCLYAVSCLARESEEGLEEFIKRDGFSVLLRALQTNIQKLNIKSAFLLSSLCNKKPKIKNELINMGYIEQLINQLGIHSQMSKETHPPSLEHILNAIIGIVEDNERALEIARRPELEFKSLLDHVIRNSEKKDQYREENEYAKILVQMVFQETENGEEER